ncbi:hypothetical protein HO173_012612 [Letharia columbiana]|uniref:Uncharacterized protein n=1 Tax=Letharia columbiana TaxID=112416 RepID=A0A8H6FEX3_9LECA|nr:uncharacterized protein HO173_012612 [Letharia columbiana]KAF6225982.1 hypothetical protein HO173_012612 [Letharia columbiana]
MPSLLTIALALTLLAATHAATPSEVEAGTLPGFTGATSAHAGDYLTSTFCFCAAALPIPQHYSEAHYFQFEYYNQHRNRTFILSDLCLADADAAATCLAPRPGDRITLGNGVDWAGPLCRTWYHGVPTGSASDTLCYEPSRTADDWRRWRLPGPDVLRFNGQSRHLDPMGGQGPVLRGKAEAEGECEWLCDEHAGMPALRDNGLAQCHVVVYEDLDDMCDGCA